MKYAFLLVALGLWGFSFTQRILIANGHLHPVEGQEFSSSLIEIENGVITGIKNALSYKYNPLDWDTVIDASNQHIYPGIVAPNSTLGITEIDAVRATNDFYEVGRFNPHIRAQIAFNPESKVLETVKTNGVLLVQTTPRGGLISGCSSVMATDGWNWEDATILEDDGIHINWPSADWNSSRKEDNGAANSEINYSDEVRSLTQFFEVAKAYADNKQAAQDIRLEALKPCFKGKRRTYFHANDVRQLSDILEFCAKLQPNYPVIIGGNDAPLLGQRLIDARIPIMLERLHRLPDLDEDNIDLPFCLPATLSKMGVQFCLQNEGGMEAMNARNIPFLAGTAQAYGLSEKEALKSITLSPCEIMGISDKYGSLKIGKSATLFISKGPALDMRTNQVTHVLIHGKIKNCQNFQEGLFLKYQKKYAEISD
jgi:hypothetical protein